MLSRRLFKAEDALAEKELELSKLRSQLAHTQSLILTGPSLEANARRVSGSFAGSMLSPSRSRSLNCPGGKRTVSEMGALGLGTPLRSEMSWRSGLGETVSRTGEEQEILKEKVRFSFCPDHLRSAQKLILYVLQRHRNSLSSDNWRKRT